jgi:hypothetical protein
VGSLGEYFALPPILLRRVSYPLPRRLSKAPNMLN